MMVYRRHIRRNHVLLDLHGLTASLCHQTYGNIHNKERRDITWPHLHISWPIRSQWGPEEEVWSMLLSVKRLSADCLMNLSRWGLTLLLISHVKRRLHRSKEKTPVSLSGEKQSRKPKSQWRQRETDFTKPWNICLIVRICNESLVMMNSKISITCSVLSKSQIQM